MRREFFASAARPNAAHLALARLEQTGRPLGVITQNIDGVHQLADSSTVIKIHGTAREVMCIGAAPARHPQRRTDTVGLTRRSGGAGEVLPPAVESALGASRP